MIFNKSVIMYLFMYLFRQSTCFLTRATAASGRFWLDGTLFTPQYPQRQR